MVPELAAVVAAVVAAGDLSPLCSAGTAGKKANQNKKRQGHENGPAFCFLNYALAAPHDII